MNIRATNSFTNILLLTISLVAFLSGSAATLLAQSRTAPQPIPQPNSGRDLGSRTSQVRALEIESESKRDPQAILAQVNEDLTRVRMINEEMTGMISSSGTLDYKYISDMTGEVKKRSTRLKNNLAGLPKPDKDQKRSKVKGQTTQDQLKLSLSSLADLIKGFVTNPIFSDTGAPDTKLALKARLDLEDIIELSDKISKSAEKLSSKSH